MRRYGTRGHQELAAVGRHPGATRTRRLRMRPSAWVLGTLFIDGATEECSTTVNVSALRGSEFWLIVYTPPNKEFTSSLCPKIRLSLQPVPFSNEEPDSERLRDLLENAQPVGELWTHSGIPLDHLWGRVSKT